MPHKFKQPREQQHHKRLPLVKEELEGEEHEDRALYVSMAKPHPGAPSAESHEAVASESPSVESNYGRIESSPLPLRRALLSSVTGQKCGPSTPVPLWKMYDNPLQDAIEPANPNANPSRGAPSMLNGCHRVSVSARKLAASLWEMQGVIEHQHGEVKEDEISSKDYTELGSCDDRHRLKERKRSPKGKERVSQHVNSLASHHYHQQCHHDDKAGSSKHRKQRKGSGRDSQQHSPAAPSPPQYLVL